MTLTTDDRQQIAETLALHAYVSDANQLDRLEEIFSPDAVYDMSRTASGMGAFEGIDTIRAAAARLNGSGHAPAAHLVTNIVITDGSDGPDGPDGTATARSRGLMIMHDGSVHAVDYDDTLRRRDGRWLIGRRMITPVYPAPVPSRAG